MLLVYHTTFDCLLERDSLPVVLGPVPVFDRRREPPFSPFVAAYRLVRGEWLAVTIRFSVHPGPDFFCFLWLPIVSPFFRRGNITPLFLSLRNQDER